MSRNRVIYQSEALYISKEATSQTSGHHAQLERVQSANYSFNISRQDVNQFGQLAKVGSMVLEAPTVSADISYLLTDGHNEKALGFYLKGPSDQDEGSFVSGHLADGSGKNLYITTVPEGKDANGVLVSGNNNMVIGIGNAYVTDYTLDLSVGSLPTVSVSFEASNIRSSTGSLIESPAINQTDGSSYSTYIGLTGQDQAPTGVQLPTATTGHSHEIALRPGDIEIDISAFDGQTIADINTPDRESAHIQSASLSIPLSRTSLERLGTKFAYARAVDFPIQATLSVNAIVNESVAANLASVIDDESTKTVTIKLKKETGENAIVYKMKGAQLISESFSSSIGSNKSVDLTFATSIGGPRDTTNGVFVSGAYTGVAFHPAN